MPVSPDPTLADYLILPIFIRPAGSTPISEGLMLLTDDGRLQHPISHPRPQAGQTYLVQVDGVPDASHADAVACAARSGRLRYFALPRRAGSNPDWLWPRNPPIRQRQDQPTGWLTITLSEGKNRQIRRMTAAVGLPTLRLIRIAIGPFSLATHPLLPGESMTVDAGKL